MLLLGVSKAESPEGEGCQGTERSPGPVLSFHRWEARSLGEFTELELLPRKECHVLLSYTRGP